MKKLCFLIVSLLVSASLSFGQETIQKAPNALLSDKIFTELTDESLHPQKQTLQNNSSENFAYNILLANDTETVFQTETKKLVIVFPQEIVLSVLPEIVTLHKNILDKKFTIKIDILLTANDIESINHYSTNEERNNYTFAGSKTYIESLPTTENIASIIIERDDTISLRSRLNFLGDIVKIVPAGISFSEKHIMAPLGYFSSVITSFAHSNTPYFIDGYLLSFHRLKLIKDNYFLGTWLSNEIPSVSIGLHTNNTQSVFSMLTTLCDEFTNCNLENSDTNYGFFQFFNNTFFITEKMYIVLFLISISVILFAFAQFSFLKGSHKNIHKKEFKKTWYLLPLIVLVTTLFLILSQTIVDSLIQDNSPLRLYSVIIKILYTSLFLFLFSLVRYIIKLPLTGFIYAYILSLSAVLNIIIFSLVEITLIPLFIVQYIIIQLSQRARKTIPIILYLFLMFLPYTPFVINLFTSTEVLKNETINNASFIANFLFACFMLPIEIMCIRILIKLKVWGMRLKIKPKNIITQTSIISLLLLIITITLASINKITANTNTPVINQYTDSDFTIQTTQEKKYGISKKTITLDSVPQVIRYEIEVTTEKTVPIYSANYPYNIFFKEKTAIFSLDEYPPMPFTLEFLTKEGPVSCKISAWVQTNAGIEKIYLEHHY